MSSAGDELRLSVSLDFLDFSGEATIETLVSRPWSSAAFSGERHTLVLRLEGAGARDAAKAFLAGLEERQFALRGHIVADIAAVGTSENEEGTVSLTLEALTVEAR